MSFINLCKQVAILDAQYKESGQGVDIIVESGPDYISVWIAHLEDRESSGGNLEATFLENQDRDVFSFECTYEEFEKHCEMLRQQLQLESMLKLI